MMKRMMRLLALTAAVAWGGGCIVEAGPPRGAVIVESGHVHTEYCGHYYYRGSWYYTQGHHHGPGCGHVYRGGVWVVAD